MSLYQKFQKPTRPENETLDKVSEHIKKAEALLTARGMCYGFYKNYPGDRFLEWSLETKKILGFSDNISKGPLLGMPVVERLAFYPFLALFVEDALKDLEKLMSGFNGIVANTDQFFQKYEEEVCQNFNK
jgi:hypothetical protein